MSPLARKLQVFADLEPEDVRRLDALCADTRQFRAGEDLIAEGDRPEQVHLLLEGWACRYKLLPDGNRQIVAFLLPGDICDVHIFFLKKMDHAIGLLSDAQVALIPQRQMLELFEERPTLARALWWSTLVDEGVLREWIVNMGQRDAYKRIAHLFAELHVRRALVGGVDGSGFDLPLTQADLGDTVGLTPVHVNRTLQRMRAEGLITLTQRRLHIPDVERLKAVAEFEPNYLHLDRRTHQSAFAD